MARSCLGSENQGPQVSLPREVHGGPGQTSWSPALWAKCLQPDCHFRSQGLHLGSKGVIVIPSSNALSSVFTCLSSQPTTFLHKL